jgi:GGDEF domain-containing protein
LCAAIAEPIDFHGSSLSVSASLGSAMYLEEGMSAEQLIDMADRRMYEAKRSHKMRLAS